MALTRSERRRKLQRLAELLNFMTVDEMFDAVVTDVSCPGICTNVVPWCEYNTDVAIDERSGYCPNCGTNSVQSALVLTGAL